MIDIFTSAFESMWGANPTARVRLRVGSHTIQRALSSGATFVKQLIDDPSKSDSVVNLRYPQSLENKLDPVLDGRKFELQLNGETRWLPFEVSSRKPIGGIVVIDGRSLSSDIVRAFRNEIENHPEFVVTMTGDNFTSQGIKSNINRNSELTELMGRADPETMTVKFIASETGSARTGGTITLNGDEYNVEQMLPDAAGILVDLVVKKRRLS
jgi:hypothetical protein